MVLRHAGCSIDKPSPGYFDAPCVRTDCFRSGARNILVGERQDSDVLLAPRRNESQVVVFLVAEALDVFDD